MKACMCHNIMYRKILTFIIIISVFLVACRASVEDYGETDKVIEKQLEGLNDSYKDTISEIYKADTKNLLYYETYLEDGSILGIGMNKVRDDREISYRKNLYDGDNPVETVYLFDINDGVYIDISNNIFARKDGIRNEGIDLYNKAKYKDLSNLHDILQSREIIEVIKENDNTKITFDDGTYRIYNKDYILIEETTYSEGIEQKVVLSDIKSDADELFDQYMSMTESMVEVDDIKE